MRAFDLSKGYTVQLYARREGVLAMVTAYLSYGYNTFTCANGQCCRRWQAPITSPVPALRYGPLRGLDHFGLLHQAADEPRKDKAMEGKHSPPVQVAENAEGFEEGRLLHAASSGVRSVSYTHLTLTTN